MLAHFSDGNCRMCSSFLHLAAQNDLTIKSIIAIVSPTTIRVVGRRIPFIINFPRFIGSLLKIINLAHYQLDLFLLPFSFPLHHQQKCHEGTIAPPITMIF